MNADAIEEWDKMYKKEGEGTRIEAIRRQEVPFIAAESTQVWGTQGIARSLIRMVIMYLGGQNPSLWEPLVVSNMHDKGSWEEDILVGSHPSLPIVVICFFAKPKKLARVEFLLRYLASYQM